MKKRISYLTYLLTAFLLVSNLAYATTINPTAKPIVRTSSDGTTLTFLCVTSAKDEATGVKVEDSYTEAPSWCSKAVTKVIFDSSFSKYKPTSTANWFNGCSNLKDIDGISNVNTESVTNMQSMFDACSSLTILDLSCFNTENVKNMRYMFNACIALRTIYVSNAWNTNNLTVMNFYNSGYMFQGCINIVGGNGTTYKALANRTDFSYAKIDKGTNNPGYFTDIALEEDGVRKAYSVLENNILTFYYDWKKDNRQGVSYPIEKDYTSPFSYSTINGVEDKNSLPGWYYNREQIKKVVFDNSFKYYHPGKTRNWFYSCSDILSFDGIENLRTENVTDMSCMFMNCTSLKNLNLNPLNTENVINMTNMFAGCTSLETIDVSNFNTSTVIYMAYMFSGCNKLQELDVRNFNTSNVERMEGMFCDCNTLKTLDIKNFRTSNVIRMDILFYGCNSLNSLDVTHFDTSNVTNMSSMFNRCSNLVNLNLSNFKTNKVSDMSYMFYKCSNLESLNISSFETNNTKNLSGIFAECSNLTSLSLCNFDTNSVIDVTKMFEGCKALKTITVSNMWNLGEQAKSTDMFLNCTSLTGSNFTSFKPDCINSEYAHIDYGSQNPGYFTDCDGSIHQPYAIVKENVLTFYYDNMMNLREGEKYSIEPLYSHTNLPKWHGKWTHATVDKSFANYHPTSTAWWFAGSGKSSITITDLCNLSTDQVISMEGMFSGCEGLEALDVSHFNTSKVTTMKWMFYICTHLKSLELSNFDTSNVTDMQQMFDGCYQIESLNVSSFNTSKVQLMCGMFAGCYALKSLDVTNFDTSNVVDMGAMFNQCKTLTTLDVSNFNTSKVTNMSSIFLGCSALTSLNVTKFSTSNVTNMTLMFDGCSNLESLDLTNFNTSKVEDMTCMFRNCENLKNLDLCHFDTRNVKIMRGIFAGCTNLENIFANEKWTVSALDEKYEGEDFFYGNTALVGGKGTKYDSSHTDYTYARIDGGTSNPGYFTYRDASGKKGDANGDGKVDATDIVEMVNAKAGHPSKLFIMRNADMDSSGAIISKDIDEVVNIIVSK